MINETHDTYQYLKPKYDSFSKSDLIIPGKEPIDIVLDLNYLNINIVGVKEIHYSRLVLNIISTYYGSIKKKMLHNFTVFFYWKK